jgi:hypothetical protein
MVDRPDVTMRLEKQVALIIGFLGMFSLVVTTLENYALLWVTPRERGKEIHAVVCHYLTERVMYKRD